MAAPDLCTRCLVTAEVEKVGTASGRRYFKCPKCRKTWVEKNPHAVALGSLGGKKAAENMTEEQRQQRAEAGGEATRRLILKAKNDLK